MYATTKTSPQLFISTHASERMEERVISPGMVNFCAKSYLDGSAVRRDDNNGGWRVYVENAKGLFWMAVDPDSRVIKSVGWNTESGSL